MKNNVIIFILVLILSGCSQPGIKLLNLNTDETVFFSGKSGYFDEIVPMPINSKFIYTIYREEDHLKLDKRDLSGALVKGHHIPLFSEYYGFNKYALSLDETKFVYYKNNTNNIYLYDLLTKSEFLLCKSIVSSEVTIVGIFWISNNELIIILDADEDIGRKVGEILKVDVSSKKIVARLEFEDPMNFSFSPSSMLLAVAPMIRGTGIKIIDLKKMVIISEVPNSNKSSWENLPAWNHNGTKLAYVDGNNVLSIFNSQDKKSTSIRQVPKNDVCYYVAYPNDNTCVLEHGQPGGKSKIYFIDLNTNKTIRTISDVWGAVVFADNGNVIAYVKH